jgi:hypothetical protein
MNVDGSKIKRLIESYGAEKDYDQKTQLRRFCEDFNLNYIQFHAYTKGTQNLGLKIIYRLMEIFPNLNLNWLLKDEENMFVGKENSLPMILKEPQEKYSKKIGQEDIFHKLEDILVEIKKISTKEE